MDQNLRDNVFLLDATTTIFVVLAAVIPQGFGSRVGG
jgi:hypothetical protein